VELVLVGVDYNDDMVDVDFVVEKNFDDLE
jgi:hypothetical protein